MADLEDAKLNGSINDTRGAEATVSSSSSSSPSGIQWDAVLAEFVAMLLFVYIGCGEYTPRCPPSRRQSSDKQAASASACARPPCACAPASAMNLSVRGCRSMTPLFEAARKLLEFEVQVMTSDYNFIAPSVMIHDRTHGIVTKKRDETPMS